MKIIQLASFQNSCKCTSRTVLHLKCCITGGKKLELKRNGHALYCLKSNGVMDCPANVFHSGFVQKKPVYFDVTVLCV